MLLNSGSSSSNNLSLAIGFSRKLTIEDSSPTGRLLFADRVTIVDC